MFIERSYYLTRIFHSNIFKIFSLIFVFGVLIPNTAAEACFSISPSNPTVADGIDVDASCSTNPQGNSLSYDWDWGDGYSYSGGPTNDHVYWDAAEGTYTVTLTISDGSGYSDSSSKSIFVEDVNDPRIRTIYVYPKGESASSEWWVENNPQLPKDKDAVIRYDIADNGEVSSHSLEVDGSQVRSGDPDFSGSTSKKYTTTIDLSEGYHSFSVTAQDTGGNTLSYSSPSFTVGDPNSPPSASFTTDSPVLTSEDFGLSAWGSSDPDGDSLNYEWDTDEDGIYDDASGVSPSESKSDDGSYTISLRVSDGNGGSDTYTGSVSVENRDPTASFSFSPSNPAIGELVSFNGAGSDNDGSISSHEWDWTNDGVFDASGPNPTHSYSSEGDYTVKLRVTDNDGGKDVYTNVVSVGDQTAPEINSISPTGTVKDSKPSLSVEFSDNYALSSYTLRLNTDQVSSGSISGTSDTASYNPGKLSAGQHELKWSVTDSSGNSNSKTGVFTVSILQSQSNSNAPTGSLWVQSSDLHWADGSTEYWLEDASVANSNSSGPSGALWIQDTKIHWIDQLGDERSYQGSEVATNVGGPSGTLWVQNGYIHYIDQDGDERVTDGK